MSEVPDPGLAALEARLRHDLACLNYPPANWVPARRHQGREVADVVVIGGGMCGLVATFSLLRLGIRNLRVLDRAPAGSEGPWVTYARMETLRSPKQLVGPAAALPALTFRAWYEAQFGEAAWDALGKIPRPMWMDYLRWYRDVLALPVENGVEVTRIEPAPGGLLRLPLEGAAEPEVFARKVVMATGREGLGEPYIPDFVKDLPRGTLGALGRSDRFFRAAWPPGRGGGGRRLGGRQRGRGARGRCCRGAPADPAQKHAAGQQADGHRQPRLHPRLSGPARSLALAVHALCR